MGGAQQMERLFLKNMLLKKRRPKATCFEIILPIVLFIILVIVRKAYEKKIETIGPFFYEHNEIFPFSTMYFGDGLANQMETTAQAPTPTPPPPACTSSGNKWTDSRCVSDCTGSGNKTCHNKCASRCASTCPCNPAPTPAPTPAQNLMNMPQNLMNMTNGLTSDLNNMTNNLKQHLHPLLDEFVCTADFPTLAATLLEPILNLNHSWWHDSSSSTTIAEELLSLDIGKASAWVRDAVLEVQHWDVDSFIHTAEDMRQGYLASHWASQLEEAGPHVDNELALLRGELNSGQTTVIEGRVLQWLNDTCHLQGPVLGGWNSTALAHDLECMYGWLEESGVAGWVNGSKYSAVLAPLHAMLNTIKIDTINMTTVSSDIARWAATFSEENADAVADIVDKGAWWLSYFVRKGSKTAQILA
jgi:hypothetical protein